MEHILISACLLGEPVRYDGQSCPLVHPAMDQLKRKAVLIPICPEVDGGLPIPRPPAEIHEGKVLTIEGHEVTSAFEAGADKALETAMARGATLALLKEKSPSCGVNQIYDGSFSGTRIPGQGLTAQTLREAGITVFSDEQIEALLARL